MAQGGGAGDGKGGEAGLLLLVDGSSLLHRAFFALPALTSPGGEPTGAVYGFLTMLLRLLQDERPTHLAVALDRPEPTFRHREFAAYKAQRAEMPAELRSQVPLFHRALRALAVPTVDHAGAEADDVLGTLSARAVGAGFAVRIVTGDRDALQLVGDGIEVLYTRRGITDLERMDEAAVRQRYGVPPARLVDVKALMGDPSDNIPGVPAVGEKTACRLVAAYGSVDGLLAQLGQVGPPRVQAALREHADQVRRNLRLCTIARDLPIPWEPDALRRLPPDPAAARALLEEMGAHALAARFDLGRTGTPPPVGARPAPEADDARGAAGARARPAPGSTAGADAPGAAAEAARGEDRAASADAGAAREEAPAYVGLVREAVSGPALAAALAAHAGPAALGARVAGGRVVALAALRLPAGSGARTPGATPVAPMPPALLWSGEGDPPVLPAIAEMLVHDAKPVCHLARAGGGDWRTPAFDGHLAAYLMEPDRSGYPLADLCRQFAVPVPVADDPAEAAAAVAGLRAAVEDSLAQHGLERVYREIELPLVAVLVDMERAGVMVDRAALAALEREFSERLARAQREVEEAAGESFNVNSTQQLARILFERLGLKPPKRTKTGYSTDAEVLEQLALEHPLPAKVLAHRTLQKLQSTYVEALGGLVGPDGRIHSTWQQTVAVTGRLASHNPNLQNIPVREDVGRPIRRVFVAPEGSLLVAADYSQVELRILAHLSGDDGLVEAFRAGEDIHRRTAAEVWGVPLAEVTAAQRSAAKAVNFGIVYGISDFGLARQLSCGQAEARALIERYFARYPGVKRYLDGVVEEARQRGVVRTMYGRLRRLPDITSRNWARRSFAERTAMNSPIQGTAADLIKLAMVRAHSELRRRGLEARLILQVHDELIFEAPREERDEVADLARRAMEGVAELSVPLAVEVQAGPNWLDLQEVPAAVG